MKYVYKLHLEKVLLLSTFFFMGFNVLAMAFKTGVIAYRNLLKTIAYKIIEAFSFVYVFYVTDSLLVQLTYLS